VMKRNAAPGFLQTNLREIAQSLPTPRSARHRELLPLVLREWEPELQEHLSRESAETIRFRVEGLESIKKKASRLSKALDAIDEHGRLSIVAEMVDERWRLESVTPRGFNARARDFSDQDQRLKKARDYLAQLAAISPEKYWPTGGARKLEGYQVLLDAEAIYEWFSGKRAARGVSRGKESGPFFRFASALWPIIFEKGCAGLPAAMRKWADGRRKHNERSPLIANIAMQNPTWGIFDRKKMIPPM
jgi:hypothetical protein